MQAERLVASGSGRHVLLGVSPDLLVSIGRSDDGASGSALGCAPSPPGTMQKLDPHTAPFLFGCQGCIQLLKFLHCIDTGEPQNIRYGVLALRGFGCCVGRRKLTKFRGAVIMG